MQLGPHSNGPLSVLTSDRSVSTSMNIGFSVLAIILEPFLLTAISSVTA